MRRRISLQTDFRPANLPDSHPDSRLSTGVESSVPAALPVPRPVPLRWERWALWLILCVFVIVGLNHIRTNTVYGQDFLLHSTATQNLIAHPEQWFPQDFTNRPLVYWIGALGHWLMPGTREWDTAGMIFIVLNTLALFLLHRTTLRFIRSPGLRLSTVLLAGFLPATQVAGIVYAADAVSQLPFALTIWSLLASLEATSHRSRVSYALLAGFALCLGDFARFPFIVLIPTTLVALLFAWRWQRITWRQGVLIGCLALIAPTLLTGWIQLRAARLLADKSSHHTFNWHGTGEMTFSSLLLPKATDVRILNAPGYWDSQMIDGNPRYVILINNSYSYPALLHLSIFTDVLDYANDGQNDDGAIRPDPQKTLARWSVRLGLLFSVSTLLALLWFMVRCVRSIWHLAAAPSTGTLLWGLMALAWHLPIALTLPFVYNSYDWGYWLARLIIPALWGYAVVLLATLDELLPPRRWLTGLVTALVAAQAILHIRSVWY